MGWKGYAIFIESMATEEALAAFPGAFTFNDHRFDVEDAFGGPVSDRLKKGTQNLLAEFIISQRGPWVVLLDPHWFTLDWHEYGIFAQLSQGRRIFAIFMESFSGTYWFWYYVDGALRREVYRVDLDIHEKGTPLLEEDNIQLSWYEEEYLFLMLERVTGWTWEHMEALTYVGVDVDRKWYGMYRIHPDEQVIVRTFLEQSRGSVFPVLSTDENGYLESIYLKHVELSQVGRLTHLKSLTLCGSRLSPEIWSLSHLEELLLQDNDITVLPPEIGQLSNLKLLNVHEPLVSHLPAEIDQLANLEQLTICGTQLSTLPSTIGNLMKLRRLILDQNTQLTHLPPEIARLTALQELSVKGTRLCEWPAAIGHLARLRRFEMSDTPLCSAEGDGSFEL